MEGDGAPILEIRNLVVEFATAANTIRAVDDVSLSLYPGRTVCIVGESGSGKSVLSRSILQILDPGGSIVGGEILFRSRREPGGGATINLTRLNPRGKAMRSVRGRNIAMIFQEPMSSLSPIHTIGDQIEEALRLHRPISKAAARIRVVELLDMVEMPNAASVVDSYSFQLSGGMRQRAMIAMALACEPELLIADEPTTALDVTIQAEILELIRNLQKSLNMAILFITHDMGVVAEIADDVMVMLKGKILERGTVEQIYASPQHPYTQSLLDAAMLLGQPSQKRLELRARRPPGTTVLTTTGLTKNYDLATSRLFRRDVRSVTALRDVTIELRAGENLGVVGESGSGKTTLAQCIQGIRLPSAGRISLIDATGQTIETAFMPDGQRKSIWRDLRYIFQDPYNSLNPRLTVGEIVAEPLINFNIGTPSDRRKRVATLLERVGLPSSAMNRYPHTFSGGQRQRICIARAIATEPRIVVADEATSALDMGLRGQIMDLLLDLQEGLDLSYIFISHDVGLVRYFCDRVVVMYKGRVVEAGDTETVCGTPEHPYTAALLSAVPVSDPTMRNMSKRTRYHEA